MSSDIGHRPQRIKPAPKPQPPKGIGHVEPTAGLVSRWVGASHWSIEDGIALAFGTDPQGINWQSVPNGYGRCIDLSETVARYRDAARGAIEQGSLPREPSPVDFIPWAESTELLLFHPVWKEALGLPVGWYEENLLLQVQRRRWLVSRWARMGLWTFEEAAHLSLNVSPESARDSSFRKTNTQFVQEIEHRLKSAQRDAILYSQTLDGFGPPEAFLGWAERSGFPFHPSWAELIVKQEPEQPVEIQHPAPAAPTLDLPTRERKSLLKLVIGMAMGGYGYDPRSMRNTATSDILADLERKGIGLDRDTVLKYLREGAELIDQDRLDE